MAGQLTVEIEVVASVSPIVRDPAASSGSYRDRLGIGFEGSAGDYVFTDSLPGVKHFGLWPLSEAAEACFGTPVWPDDLPVPQASVEFEVANVGATAAELAAAGLELLHDARTKPWGQTTARFLSPEGLLIAVCRTTLVPRGRRRRVTTACPQRRGAPIVRTA